jgi:hypothetical protein
MGQLSLPPGARSADPLQSPTASWGGGLPGVTLHGPVQWRAKETPAWPAVDLIFVSAVCQQIVGVKGKPHFRRYMILHIQAGASWFPVIRTERTSVRRRGVESSIRHTTRSETRRRVLIFTKLLHRHCKISTRCQSMSYGRGNAVDSILTVPARKLQEI